MADSAQITRLLKAHREGERDAFDRLVGIVYAELKMMARRELGRGRPEGLRTTALVHEAYVRLAEPGSVDWDDRRHFFGIAARAMRQIVVDEARRGRALKRGGGLGTWTLDGREIPIEEQSGAVLAIDEALERLERIEGRLVKVVECRFFADLTFDETAAALGVSRRTVERDWAKARGWLRRALGEV